MKKLTIKAFSLVELLVVITIMAIISDAAQCRAEDDEA